MMNTGDTEPDITIPMYDWEKLCNENANLKGQAANAAEDWSKSHALTVILSDKLLQAQAENTNLKDQVVKLQQANGEMAVLWTEQEEKIIDLRDALNELFTLVRYETGLPGSAANGITDPTGAIDEGVVSANETLNKVTAILEGK